MNLISIIEINSGIINRMEASPQYTKNITCLIIDKIRNGLSI